MSDERIGRAAVRRMSWRILPLIGLGYGIAYMDRVNISFASVLHRRSAAVGVAAIVLATRHVRRSTRAVIPAVVSTA